MSHRANPWGCPRPPSTSRSSKDEAIYRGWNFHHFMEINHGDHRIYIDIYIYHIIHIYIYISYISYIIWPITEISEYTWYIYIYILPITTYQWYDPHSMSPSFLVQIPTCGDDSSCLVIQMRSTRCRRLGRWTAPICRPARNGGNGTKVESWIWMGYCK
jgi:hypothetical protein